MKGTYITKPTPLQCWRPEAQDKGVAGPGSPEASLSSLQTTVFSVCPPMNICVLISSYTDTRQVASGSTLVTFRASQLALVSSRRKAIAREGSAVGVNKNTPDSVENEET